MNLYGWSLRAFGNVLASANSSVLKAATAHFVQSQKDESAIPRGKAWLQTLIEKGFPLREARERPAEPIDGGLLTMQMETEAHVFATYSIVRAIAADDHIDLARESSDWAQPVVSAFHRELGDCRFSQSKECPRELHSWIWKLNHGTPLFGDDFRTNWSYYTIFTHQELAAMVPVFQAAVDYERPVPESTPNYPRNPGVMRRLSEGPRQFAQDLSKWLGQIKEAGQDAFILWW
jgi:hypothetical protein